MQNPEKNKNIGLQVVITAHTNNPTPITSLSSRSLLLIFLEPRPSPDSIFFFAKFLRIARYTSPKIKASRYIRTISPKPFVKVFIIRIFYHFLIKTKIKSPVLKKRKRGHKYSQEARHNILKRGPDFRVKNKQISNN